MSKKLEPGMAFDTAKLNKIFAFLSLIFLATTFWIFLDDYLRPWKKIQVDAMKIRQQKLDIQIAEENKKISAEKLAESQSKIANGEKLVQERKKLISKVEDDLKKIDKKIQEETINNGVLNAKIGEVNFNWELANSHGGHGSEGLHQKLTELKKQFADSKDRLKLYQGEFKKLNLETEELKKELLSSQKDLNSMVATRNLLQVSRDKTEITPLFLVRNSPMIDFLDPTLKVQQVVLNNITDDRFFQQVPKVDRCMTCHTFIDKKGFEDQSNPFKTHPNLDLILGEKSPHPMKQIGCTICHGGEGHRVNDFSSAAHTPKSPEQAKEWIAKYNWHAPHKVPQPMLKNGFAESACIKCHKDVEYIPHANTLNEGLANIEKFGCNGCHKIDGFEERRKPGPSLLKVKGKISKEFFKNWVWDPKSFNKHSKMPVYFNQDNNRRPDFMLKNIAEVNAIADFVWSISKDYQPFDNYQGGNSERGKALVKQIGCLGCHGVEGLEEESSKTKSHAGSYLTGLGSKLDPDWLVSWLKKPSHYQSDTIMPSFRLTDAEANDIAAFLLGQKNKTFERLKFEPLNKGARDEILLSYLSAFDTVEVAKQKISAMNDQERTIELGRRSVGKYGCYSCHNIDGFADRAPIGPDLTKIGSKPIMQFGFAHEKVERSRDGWIQAHLQNPSRWDNGVDKPFGDLNKMPNFYMSAKEAETITVALLGRVSDYIPAEGMRQYTGHEKLANQGMKVVTKYNCAGCHKIDGMRGNLSELYQDDLNEGPPYLVLEGERVQTDWLHNFLGNVHPIRPWVKVRMPSFNLSNEEKNQIVSAFQSKAMTKTFEDNKTQIVWESGEREAAQKLFNTLACTSCHAAGFTSDVPSAPDLHHVKRRLRPDWIKKWLSNPQAILPYTPMPNFWDGGVANEPDILGGDPEKQIQALTKYILEFSKENLYGE
jgi:mono/diheme cytochrome c family protein